MWIMNMENGDPDEPVRVNAGFLDEDRIRFLVIDVVLKRFIVFMFLVKLMVLVNGISFDFLLTLYHFIPLLLFEIVGYVGVKLVNIILVWPCILINCQEFLLLICGLTRFGIDFKDFVGSFLIFAGMWILYIFLMVFYVNKVKKFSKESIRDIKEAIKECKLYIQY